MKFHPKVRIEISQALAVYDAESLNLGNEFIAEYQRGIRNIDLEPDRWERVGKITRRHVLGRFPFSFIYATKENVIWILALMHHKRHPGYWRRRLRDI